METIIHNAIALQYPESYQLMDDAEKTRFFGSAENRWGIHNREQHTVVSFARTKASALLSLFTDAKSVANGSLASMKKSLKGFEKTGDISTEICGKKASGFSFAYRTDKEDIAQTGQLIVFKAGKRFYVIHCITRQENTEQAQAELDAILASAALL